MADCRLSTFERRSVAPVCSGAPIQDDTMLVAWRFTSGLDCVRSPFGAYALWQQAPGGIGEPCGQVRGWARKVQILSVT